MKLKLLALLAAALCGANAHALQVFEGTVTVVEPTYLPGSVSFTMSTGNATCPAGKWLRWSSADPSNNKAVYATLMTAIAAGKKVRFHMNDFDATCKGTFLHLVN